MGHVRQDPDIKAMSISELRNHLMRVRRKIRLHKKKNGDARCLHNDTALYDATLPEGSEGHGRMYKTKEEHLRGCSRYIDRQQCELSGCVGPADFIGKKRKCPNCGSPGYDGVHSCFQCGVGPRVGSAP